MRQAHFGSARANLRIGSPLYARRNVVPTLHCGDASAFHDQTACILAAVKRSRWKRAHATTCCHEQACASCSRAEYIREDAVVGRRGFSVSSLHEGTCNIINLRLPTLRRVRRTFEVVRTMNAESSCHVNVLPLKVPLSPSILTNRCSHAPPPLWEQGYLEVHFESSGRRKRTLRRLDRVARRLSSSRHHSTPVTPTSFPFSSTHFPSPSCSSSSLFSLDSLSGESGNGSHREEADTEDEIPIDELAFLNAILNARRPPCGPPSEAQGQEGKDNMCRDEEAHVRFASLPSRDDALEASEDEKANEDRHLRLPSGFHRWF